MAVHTYSIAKQGGQTIGGTRFTAKDFQCKNGNDTVLADTNLAVLLAAIERHFGAKVTITSAYRDPAYNASVGGASGSYHVKGQAADITVTGIGLYEIARYADYKLGQKGGVGCYTGSRFVHVDTRGYASYWEDTGWRNAPYSGNPADDPPLDLTVDNAADMRYTDFPRYDLSETAIQDIAAMITGEQGGEDMTACRQEASQLANLNEVRRGRSATEASILRTLHDGWYAETSWDHGVTQTAIDAVRFVLIDGKRVLPRYVTEHDTFPGDVKDAKSRNAYIPHETKVKNVYGADYMFYCFFGQNQDKDIAGYFESDYSKYKDDVPWSESAAGVGFGDKATYFTNTNEVIPLHPTLFQMPVIQTGAEIAVYIDGRDVTASVGELTWSNTYLELAVTVQFDAAKSDARFTRLYHPKKGGIVRIFTPNEVFRGVIIQDDTGDRHRSRYTAADAGWYMSKCKDTYQFSEMNALQAIHKICGDLGVPAAYMDSVPLDAAVVSGVYIDKTISEVIHDILSQVGGKWNVDFVPDGIRIYRIGTFLADPKFRSSANTMLRSSTAYRGPESRSSSIEDLRSAVKVVSDTEVLAKARNDHSYQAYGFLQEVISIDPEKEDAVTAAASALNRLSAERNTLGFEMPVQLADYTRAGDVIDLDGSRYMVESAAHTISKGRHMVNVELERVETE